MITTPGLLSGEQKMEWSAPIVIPACLGEVRNFSLRTRRLEVEDIGVAHVERELPAVLLEAGGAADQHRGLAVAREDLLAPSPAGHSATIQGSQQ